MARKTTTSTKKTTPAKKTAGTKPTAKTKTATPRKRVASVKREGGTIDLFALLLDQLRADGIAPKVRWSPTNVYASLLVDGKNIGYVFRQTRTGIKIKAGVTLAELPKSVKAWKDNSRESKQYAAMGFVTSAANVTQGATALKLAAAKLAKARSGKSGKAGA